MSPLEPQYHLNRSKLLVAFSQIYVLNNFNEKFNACWGSVPKPWTQINSQK